MEAKSAVSPSADALRVAATQSAAALEKAAGEQAVDRSRSARENQQRLQSIEALKEDFRESVTAANERMMEQRRTIDISVDEETNIFVVRVSDPESGEKIRQIPSEEALNVARNIDRLTGILVDKKV